MKLNRIQYIIPKIFIMIFLSILILSSGALAGEQIIFDDRPGEGTQYVDKEDGERIYINTLEDAIKAVEDNGEIIIKEPQDIQNIYEGFKIGKGDDILSDSKSITIRGEGIVPIESPAEQDSVIEIEDNNQRQITIENVLFINGEHAIEAKSGSNVVINDIAIGNTITDTPFILNDNIQSSGIGGATLQDNGVYYPDSYSQLPNDVVRAVNGDLKLETIGTDPTGLIYNRQEEPLEYNPITTSNYEGQIDVGSPDNSLNPEDDDNIQTPFYSLQAAVDAASPDSVINVYDRGEPYEMVSLNGLGKSGLNDVTIIGQSEPNSAVPEVLGFEGNYPGSYDIRNLQITEGVVVDADSVNLDVRKNYWLSPDGPSPDDIEITTGTAANILSEPFCTDDRCQNEYSFSDLNQCINLESRNSNDNVLHSSSYGCDVFSDEIDITIHKFENIEDSSRLELYNFEYTDFREADITISTNSNENVDVDVNILSSDNSVDGEFNIPTSESSTSGTIEAQFSTIIDQLDVGESLDLNPKAQITVNNNPEFVIPLDRTRVTGISQDDDLFRLPDDMGRNQGSIQRDSFIGLSRNETTFVSRFNAGNTEETSFQDNIIPPTRTTGGETQDGARGTVEFFEELRSNPDRAAIVRPENPLRVGMSVQGISEARGHQLNITYAVQGESGNNIDVQLVNENSEEIFTNRIQHKSLLEITSSDEREPFSSASDTEDLETKTKEIPLHSSEVEFVNENGVLYIVFENMDIHEDTVLLLYNLEVHSTDEIQEVEEVDDDDSGDETAIRNPDERPGGFTVSFNVDGSQNTEYDTYDVEPNENLSSTIIIENTGDTTINSTFAVLDEYETPQQRYPNEDNLDGDTLTQEEELERFELRVAGGERETRPISTSWNESKFGNHTVKIYEVDEDDDGDDVYRNIDDRAGVTPQFDAYVFQKATFEVFDINVPEEHLTHDNFNSEIKVHNIGDLEGERTVKARFGDWESQQTINLAGGDARGDITSEETTIRFARDVHPDNGSKNDFTFREYTTIDDVVDHVHSSVSGPFEVDDTPLSYSSRLDNTYYRPNAPFGTGEGEHMYNVEILNEMDGEIFSDVEDALISEEDREVNLNKIVINDLNVNTKSGDLSQRPSEDEGTVYASAYPYVQPSHGLQSNSLRGESYVAGANVRGGLGTMYSYNSDVRDSEINRGATPLNLQEIGSITQPSNRYFSIYYNHQNRYCNPDLLATDSVHDSESETEESNTTVFLPYSSNSNLDESMCEDINRYASLQLPRFAGTTTTDSTSITHPSGEFIMPHTDKDSFFDVEEEDSIMYAVATVSNPSDSQPATARFEIRSNRSVNADGNSIGLGEINSPHQDVDGGKSYDDNVVGVAAVELRPDESQEVRVPIVIRNDEGNEGVHELSIHPRSENDYIRHSNTVTPDNEMSTSPLTGDKHSQFTVPINVKTYGDTILEDFEPIDNGRDASDDDPLLAQEADLRVNQVCRAIDPSGESREEMEGSDLTDGVTQPNIIFNVDQSGSVSDEEQDIKDAIEVFAGELGDNVNYALSSFVNGSGLRGKNLGEYDDADDFINTVQSTNLQNAPSSGTSYTVPEEQFANYGDQEGPNYLIMLGDGDHFDTSYTNDDFTIISIYFDGDGNDPQDMEAIADYDEDGTLLYFDTRDADGDYGPAFEAIQTTVSGGYNVDEGLNPYSGENENDRGVVQDIGQCVNGQEGVDELAQFETTYTNYGGAEVDIRPEAMAEFETRDRHTLLYRKNSQLTGDRFFANYFEDGITEMEGKTWANITVNGEDFSIGDTFTMEPGETTTVTYERKFQEPGLYHIRVSPCRAIEGGPQHYNLQGFTGIPDTINYPTGADRLNDNAEMYQTESHGVSRGSNGYNVLTTPEMANSTFNGGLGCTSQTSSVFVYDITNPVADFDIGHSMTTIMNDNNEYTDASVTETIPEDDSNADFHVYEGGLLFLDGSSYDCPQCYQRPHFQTDDLETLTDSPSFPTFGDGVDFRHHLFRSLLFSNRMSTDNARIAGSGMHGQYPNGEFTDPQITEKGMQWTIDSDEPNYGQDGYCSKVDENQIDQHCYMERFTGIDGGTPDYYEVVPHRFTAGGDTEDIQLQVWDDETLTEGDANTNITVADIKIKSDDNKPNSYIGHESFNDLSYDKESSADTVWHRMENIFANVSYRNTPNNFESYYDDTYEGIRTCISTYGTDDEIGISQSKLHQDGGNGNIDDGTRVIDSGNYVQKINNGISTLNLHKLDVDMSTTRDGNERCLIFEETGPDGDRDRDQTFVYTVYDYAEESDSASTEVDIEADKGGNIDINSYGVNMESSVDDGATATDFIWAYNDDVSTTNNQQGYYRGGDVSFDIDTSTSGVGIACVDIRLNRGSGLTSEGGDGDIHNNCALMGDTSSGNSVHEGLYDNQASNGASYSGMGTNSGDGYHNSGGMFSAHELQMSNYEYSGSPNSGGSSMTTETEKVHIVDWHGNDVDRTYNIEIRHDETPPIIASYSDIDCTSSSCGGSDEFIISSNGYRGNAGGNGGTPIVDAEITSSSWTQNKRSKDANGCNVTLTDTDPDVKVTDFPEGEHSGTVTVNNDASVSASASCSAPDGCGSSCNGSSDPEIEYEVSYTLKITDAHGNTASRSYSETVEDDDSESKSCQDACEDDGD